MGFTEFCICSVRKEDNRLYRKQCTVAKQLFILKKYLTENIFWFPIL